MLVEITKTSSVTPVIGLKLNTPFKGQWLRLPEIGHHCWIKGLVTAIVTEVTQHTENEIHFKTKVSEYVLKLNQ